MMASPSPTTSATVHITMPITAGLFEGAVAWDACGPVANEMAVAALEGRLPDAGNAQRIRARDLAAGKFTAHSGQTLADILWDLGQRGYNQVEYIPYSSAPDINALHELVKNATFNRWPVIIEVSRAYNLPDNEAGVAYHFVTLEGIDSALGYLVCNGDTRAAIAAHPGFPACSELACNWASWATLESAGICGAIAVKPKGWTPAVVPAAPPVTPPAPADPLVSIPLSQLTAMQAQMTQAQTLMTTLAAALKAL